MVSLPTSGRGRGRPKKNNMNRSDPTTEEYFRTSHREGGPTDPIQNFFEVYESLFYLTDRTEDQKQQSDSYITNDSCFVYRKYDENIVRKSMQEYPLYVYLKQFSTADEGCYEGGEQDIVDLDDEMDDTEAKVESGNE